MELVHVYDKDGLNGCQKIMKTNLDLTKTPTMNTNQNIRVLELRNYLVKPNTADKFGDYFDTNFVTPMKELGGQTLGMFKIKGVNDRFVWMRGFSDMHTRVNFLNDFYLKSPVWKKFGSGANQMMINSDNVYLLRPLNADGYINSSEFEREKGLVVVDFYVCNSRLEKTIELFNKEYLPFLRASGMSDVSLWVSEMSENDFPRLPVFQDKNLLVSISAFKDEADYKLKLKRASKLNETLKTAMLELITTHSNLLLYPTVNLY